MRKMLEEVYRVDGRFMLFLYALNGLIELAYFYVMLFVDPSVRESAFFFYFYLAGAGAMLFLLVMLLVGAARDANPFVRMGMLLAMAAFQGATVAADVAYAALYGDFWVDGYIHLAMELALAAAYLRRWWMLKKWRALIIRETGGENIDRI
jgi:hypothetical protein